MLTEALRNPKTNPDRIDEDEEFEITYLGDCQSTQKKVRYTKIHTLGVSSLCGLATIAEYIIRRPFGERMAIYKNILKYAHRKNLVDPADPANPANPELKLDKIDPRYFLLVEQFQEARNEALKKFIKNDISSIKPNSSSAGAVSDSVSASVLAQYIRETSDLEMKKIKESLAKLDQNDAEPYQSTYYQVFSNTDESVDVIAFDEFKKLFQVKSIPEIFEFANDRANILKGDEGVESQTVSFFTAYFNKDNSCQLWIINLLQNYADQVNDVMRSKIPETEDYSTEFLEVFFKLAINEVFPNEVDEFVPYDNDTSTEKCYTRRFINIQKSDTFYSPIYTTGSQQAINSTDCIYAGGSRSAGAGHYSYCQKEGEEKFPQPAEDLVRIVGPEELVAQASDVAGHGARVSASAAAVARSASGAAASGGAQAGRQRRAGSSGDAGSLRRRYVDPESRTGRLDAIDSTYDYKHQFKKVATTGYKLYCGYGSIANYVKFLLVDERMAFYEKLFANTTDNPAGNRLKIFDDQGNITEQSKAELLILEKLLEFREEKFNEFVNSMNAHADELGYFKLITEECCRKYGITNVENFFEDFRNKYKIITPFRESFRQCSPHYYQTWMAQFLKNKLDLINLNMRSVLEAIMPAESQDQSDQISLEQHNLYEDQRTKLFQFYFENKASARISSGIEGFIKITNPEIENKELVWFHRALIIKRDEVGVAEDQKLFYQLYDYFLKKYIPREGHENIVQHDNSVPYQHFYKKENYEIFLQSAVNIETILSDLGRGEERHDLSPEIASAIISDKEKVQNFLLKIAEHFCREFSFEKQFVNLLHSDTFLTHASGSHYTTMIPAYKAENPFPDKDSNLGVEAQLQSDGQQLKIQKQNVEEAFKSAQMAPGNIDLQVSLGVRPSSTLINSYHSISFERLHGRQNNNYSFVEENCDGQLKSTFVKINSIIESLKTEIELDCRELAMAIFLSKKFGGIGTKIKEIENHYGNNSNIFNYLQQEGRLLKLIKFSYQFQQECKSQGIYSGNEKLLTDDDKKKYGLRLAFIPDEIFRFHLNKLPKGSNTKKFILKEVNKISSPSKANSL